MRFSSKRKRANYRRAGFYSRIGMIKSKYPDVDHIDAQLPDWHKEIIDSRLDKIDKERNRIRQISDLLKTRQVDHPQPINLFLNLPIFNSFIRFE